MNRIPPQNRESEQYVIGAILQRAELLHDVDLIGTDFYHNTHLIIFDAILAQSAKNNPVDILTVFDQLKQDGKLDDIGGAAYLAELTDSCIPAPAFVAYHAKQIKDAALMRKMISASEQIIENAYTPGMAEDVVNLAERSFFGLLTEQKVDFESTKTLAGKVYGQILERSRRGDPISGVSTGFSDLDVYLSGLQPSDLIVLAARPSMGKTSLAMNIAENVAVKSKNEVVVFSLEMSKEQLMKRMISSYAGVEASSIRSGFVRSEDWPKLEKTTQILSQAGIHIDDTPAMTTMQMKSKLRKILLAHPEISLVIIDYLQFIRGTGENRNQEIGGITSDLKAIAKEFNIPVLLLSQLNRGLENRTNKRPILSDLRDSGSIEQDADVVMFIYRDDYYNKARDNPQKGTAELIISKQRNGPTGTVMLAWLDKTTNFKDLAR